MGHVFLGMLRNQPIKSIDVIAGLPLCNGKHAYMRYKKLAQEIPLFYLRTNLHRFAREITHERISVNLRHTGLHALFAIETSALDYLFSENP